MSKVFTLSYAEDYVSTEFCHAEAVSALYRAATENRQDVMTILLQKGTDINARSSDGSTILHVAAARGDLNAVESILKKGINIELPNKDGLTALHIAALNTHQNVMNVLAANGSDVNSRFPDGTTLLHYGAANNLIEVVKAILQQESVLVNPKDNALFTPMVAAERKGNEEVVALLKEKTGDISVNRLVNAVKNDDFKEVKSLVLRGADVNGLGSDGWAPLHRAASYHDTIAMFLVEHGAQVNLRVKNDRTVPLYEAAWWGNLAMVKFLVENGAEINPIVNGGWTAMASADWKNYQDVVQYLKSVGGEIVSPRISGGILH